MKLPLILAHGQNVLELFAAIVAFANIMSIASVVVALRKKKEAASRVGALLGIAGLLIGVWLSWLLGWRFDASLFSIGIAALFPISAIGIALSVRKTDA